MKLSLEEKKANNKNKHLKIGPMEKKIYVSQQYFHRHHGQHSHSRIYD